MKVENCMGCSDFEVIKHVTSGDNKRNKYMCKITMFELGYMTRKKIYCPKRKCSVCGGNDKLQKHHIKRQHKFKKGQVRNYPENIKLLCHWCHMREHHPDWEWDEKIVFATTWIGRYYWITNHKGEMIIEIGYCHNEME